MNDLHSSPDLAAVELVLAQVLALSLKALVFRCHEKVLPDLRSGHHIQLVIFDGHTHSAVECWIEAFHPVRSKEQHALVVSAMLCQRKCDVSGK